MTSTNEKQLYRVRCLMTQYSDNGVCPAPCVRSKKITNVDCFQRVHRKAVQPWTSAASERMCAPIHANVALSSLQGVDHRGW